MRKTFYPNRKLIILLRPTITEKNTRIRMKFSYFPFSLVTIDYPLSTMSVCTQQQRKQQYQQKERGDKETQSKFLLSI